MNRIASTWALCLILLVPACDTSGGERQSSLADELAGLVEQSVSGRLSLHIEGVSSAIEYFIAPTPQRLGEALDADAADFELRTSDRTAILDFIRTIPHLRYTTHDRTDFRGIFRIRLRLETQDEEVWEAYLTDKGELFTTKGAYLPIEFKDERWLQKAIQSTSWLIDRQHQ